VRRRALIITLLFLACEPPHAPAALRDCNRTGTSPIDLSPIGTTAPGSAIRSVVARVNQLAPAEPACLLASLPRPLSVIASTSVTSAQPAVGRQSPRLFLLNDRLVTSFVPEGDGVHLVEFGEWVDGRRTLKGELELPRADVLPEDLPFKRVLYGSPATTCGLCHREESDAGAPEGAFTSLAFRPSPRSVVPLSELVTAHDACTRTADESGRCQVLHALFDFGEVNPGAFDAGVALFTD